MSGQNDSGAWHRELQRQQEAIEKARREAQGGNR